MECDRAERELERPACLFRIGVVSMPRVRGEAQGLWIEAFQDCSDAVGDAKDGLYDALREDGREQITEMVHTFQDACHTLVALSWQCCRERGI